MGIKSKVSVRGFENFKENRKSFLAIVITVILAIMIVMVQPIYSYYTNVKFIKGNSLLRNEVSEYLGTEIKDTIIPIMYKELYKNEENYKKVIEVEYNKHINYSKKEVYRKVLNLLSDEVIKVFGINETSEKIKAKLLAESNGIHERENFEYEIINKIFNEESDSLNKDKLLEVDRIAKVEYQNFIKKRDGEIAYTNQLYDKKFKDFQKMLKDDRKSEFEFRSLYVHENSLEEIDSHNDFGLENGYYWSLYTDTNAVFISEGVNESDAYFGGIGYIEGVSNEIKEVGNIKKLIIYLPKDIIKTGIFNEAFKAESKNSQNHDKSYIVIAIIAVFLVLIGMLNFRKKIFSNFRRIPIDIILVIWILFSVINFFMYRPYYIPMILQGGFYLDMWNIIIEVMGSLYMIFTFLFCASDIAYMNKMGIRSRFDKEKLFIFNIRKNFLNFNKSTSIKKGSKLNFIKKRLFDIKAFDLKGTKGSNDKNISERILDIIVYTLILLILALIIATIYGVIYIVIEKTFLYVFGYYSNMLSIIAIVLVVFIGIGVTFVICRQILRKELQRISVIENELEEINEQTLKIAKGDFDINFTKEEVRELDQIRSNLLDIDKGFKIAIAEELKSERMKAELITNVSHDLKTPLTSIINYVDLLQRADIKEENKIDYIKILDNKSKRLKTLIEDLFEAAKASTGNIELNIERIDIVSVLRQTTAEFREKFEDSTISYKLNLPEDKIYLNLDGARMWRVFENLIGNTLKYSMENSRVYIDLKETQNNVIFEIKNMSAYELNCDPSELKERFKRADDSRNTEGSGLGLSIANSLVELQGGTLNISIDGDLFKVIVNFKK